tara:strand:- start:574 stop:1278 length:705 start_codon:yes stop_codon:yes gene_type:complete
MAAQTASVFTKSGIADTIAVINAYYAQADMLYNEEYFGTHPITSFSMTSEENEAESARVEEIRKNTLSFKVLTDKLVEMCKMRFGVSFFEFLEPEKELVHRVCRCLDDMRYDYYGSFVQDADSLMMSLGDPEQTHYDKLMEVEVYSEIKGHWSTRVTTVSEFVGKLKQKLKEIQEQEEKVIREELKELKKLLELKGVRELSFFETLSLKKLQDSYGFEDLCELMEYVSRACIEM